MTSLSYDQWMAALCLWREARGRPTAERAAIFHVLLNRVNDTKKRWPSTLHQVITQRKQFSSFNPDDLNNKFPDRDNTADWKAWQECQDIAFATLAFDTTYGANHYESCNPDQLPLWADQEKITLRLGPFRFYKL